MADTVSATDAFWSNYDSWMNQAKASAWKVTDCDPNYESCDVPYAFLLSEEEKIQSFQASIFYVCFNTLLWIVPVIFSTTMVEDIDEALELLGDTSRVALLDTTDMLMWIGNLIIYGLGMVLAPFTFFEDVFGRGIIDFYLSYTQWGVILVGGILQIINLILVTASTFTIQADYPAIWAWWAVTLVFEVGSYVGYFMLNNSFIQYYTHELLLGLLNDFHEAGELNEDNAETINNQVDAIEAIAEASAVDSSEIEETNDDAGAINEALADN